MGARFVYQYGLLAAVFLVAATLLGCRTGKSRAGTPLPDLPVAQVEPEKVILPPAQSEKVVLPPAEPFPPTPKNRNWIALDEWGRSSGLDTSILVASNSPPSYAIGALDRMLTLVTGSRQARWNGRGCWLGFAPQLLNGILHVHTLDADKTLLPLLRSPSWTPPRSGTIVIDPGHGGRDPGARSVIGRSVEKDYTLDWALRLRPLLQAQGWQVVLTRDTDIDLSLGERVRIADRSAADVFVSLHFNSAEMNNALRGVETYCLTPLGMPSTLQRFDQDDLTQSWPNNRFDAENIQLAQRTHAALVRATQADDRGVRRARFMTVLREQQRPAVLIEGGYLSNQEEAGRIDQPAFRQRMALAVAEAFQ